jgi:hypothetical protein
MTLKILKWLTPVICYIIYTGFHLIWNYIHDLLRKVPPLPPEGPIVLPDEAIYFIIFIVWVPLGYIFLPLSEEAYQRSSKRFIRLAVITAFVSFLLRICIEWLMIDNYWDGISVYSILKLLFRPLFYIIPYFLILYYIFKKSLPYID